MSGCTSCLFDFLTSPSSPCLYSVLWYSCSPCRFIEPTPPGPALYPRSRPAPRTEYVYKRPLSSLCRAWTQVRQEGPSIVSFRPFAAARWAAASTSNGHQQHPLSRPRVKHNTTSRSMLLASSPAYFHLSAGLRRLAQCQSRPARLTRAATTSRDQSGSVTYSAPAPGKVH